MSKKEPRAPHVPPHPLIQSTRQAYAHQNTIVVTRRRELLELPRQHVEEAIRSLENAAEAKKLELAAVNARITGLTLVIERR